MSGALRCIASTFPESTSKSRQMRWYPNGALGVHALGYVSALSEADLQHIDATAYAGTP